MGRCRPYNIEKKSGQLNCFTFTYIGTYLPIARQYRFELVAGRGCTESLYIFLKYVGILFLTNEKLKK